MEHHAREAALAEATALVYRIARAQKNTVKWQRLNLGMFLPFL
jgi:hypothetical protein